MSHFRCLSNVPTMRQAVSKLTQFSNSSIRCLSSSFAFQKPPPTFCSRHATNMFAAALSQSLGSLDEITKNVRLSKHLGGGWGDSLQETLVRMDEIRTSSEANQIPEIHWSTQWEEVSTKGAGITSYLSNSNSRLMAFIDCLRNAFFGMDDSVKYNTLLIRDGWFESPSAHILPDGAKKVHFRVVLPKTEERSQPEDGISWDGKIVVNFAATGDLGYELREKWYAYPLASQHGVASLLPVQSYYGKRQPTSFGKEERIVPYETVQQGVAMGVASIDEGCSILRWLVAGKAAGGLDLEGKVCITGVCLGGIVAAMVTGICRLPVASVPILATSLPGDLWKVGGGVLSKVAEWDALCARPPALSTDMWNRIGRRREAMQASSEDNRDGPALSLSDASEILASVLNASGSPAQNPPAQLPHCTVCVSAVHDGYVPHEGADDLPRHFGPCAQGVHVAGGHVTGVLLQQRAFRKAMLQALHLQEIHFSAQNEV